MTDDKVVRMDMHKTGGTPEQVLDRAKAHNPTAVAVICILPDGDYWIDSSPDNVPTRIGLGIALGAFAHGDLASSIDSDGDA